MIRNLIILIALILVLNNCGKVGPLSLPEDKLDKSVISYPCDQECEKRFEEEIQKCLKIIYLKILKITNLIS